jgi:methionyl aminopeptidase
MNGYYGDHAYTFPVGNVSEDTQKLLRITKESLYVGIDKMREGNRVNDIGHAIQKHAEAAGYGVVRELVGHGLGRDLHEEPQVPNYGKRNTGKLLQNGLVLAIEPMINRGTHRVIQLKDGWSIVTADKKPSAHFEHDVALIDGRPVVLSTFDYIYDALGLPKQDPLFA